MPASRVASAILYDYSEGSGLLTGRSVVGPREKRSVDEMVAGQTRKYPGSPWTLRRSRTSTPVPKTGKELGGDAVVSDPPSGRRESLSSPLLKHGSEKKWETENESQ